MNKIELATKLKNIESIKNSSKPEYLEKNIDMLVNKIENCRQDIRSLIEDWLLSDKETDIIVSGIKYSDLLSKAEMTPLAAYLTLDWVAREPTTAINSLKRDYLLA